MARKWKNRVHTYEFLKSNSLIENIQIASLPVYKTNFLENIVEIEEDINLKEFIQIANENYEFSQPGNLNAGEIKGIMNERNNN